MWGKFNKLPAKSRHPAHPAHELKLISVPTSFKCKACGLQGSDFSYNCSKCLVHYHSQCIEMPPTLTAHNLHPHQLQLNFSSSTANSITPFRCYFCGICGFDQWFYRCINGCDFDVHITCFTTSVNPADIRASSSSAAPPLIVSIDEPFVNDFSGSHLNNSLPSPFVDEDEDEDEDDEKTVLESHGNRFGKIVKGAARQLKRRTGKVADSFTTGFWEGLGQQAANGVTDGVGKLFNKGKKKSLQIFPN